jgi:hypothetical protein
VEEDGEELGHLCWKRLGHRDARQQGQALAHAWWPRLEHVSPMGQFSEHMASDEGGKVGTCLGLFWVKFHLGPKMKFEDHMMLYDFY